MIRQSEQIAEFADAFAKAQAKFGRAVKDSNNPFFKSKYADLASVIDATLEHLNAEGIGVTQHPSLEYKTAGEGVEAYVTVTTRLQHKSGQWQESDLSIPAIQKDKFDAQSCGSAISYACRYALRSICTVPQADDDGNEATGRGSKEAAQSVAKNKIAELKAKVEKPTVLFYTYPENHSGHFAEFVNLAAYGSALDDVAQEGLRQVFTKFSSKITKDNTALVAHSKMGELLQVLAGDCGITVQELQHA